MHFSENPDDEPELPIWKIRKSIKKILSQDFLASVQIETQVMDDIEVVFLRIATTDNSAKSEKMAQNKLMSAKPTFLAYFPGEPYFYADHENPNESHCQVRNFF